MNGHLGLHRGPSQGPQEVCHPYCHQPLLQICALHCPQSPILDGIDRTCLLQGHCLHDFPTSIINDCDLVFTSHMWHNLFKMVGIKIRLSTVFDPQMNGQLEVINKVITDNNVPLLCHGRPTVCLGQRPSVGKILLQYLIPHITPSHSFPGGVRLAPVTSITTQHGQLKRKQWTPSCRTAMHSSVRFVSVSSRLSSTPSGTTTTNIMNSSSRWQLGVTLPSPLPDALAGAQVQGQDWASLCKSPFSYWSVLSRWPRPTTFIPSTSNRHPYP